MSSKDTIFSLHDELLTLAKEHGIEVSVLQNAISIGTEYRQPDQLCLVMLKRNGIEYGARHVSYDMGESCKKAFIKAMKIIKNE
jgi:hypothetical protein